MNLAETTEGASALPLPELLSLGVIQGLTEFLPVSSDGHLALAQLLFDLETSNLTVTIALHAGTLLATLIYFRAQISRILSDGWRVLTRRTALGDAPGAEDAVFVAVASLPTGVIGLSLKDAVERWTETPWVLGVGFLTTGFLLVSTRWAAPASRTKLTIGIALLLGCAQGAAVMPGLSRSGATIATALWLGLPVARAFELSMLMSIPAVTAALLLEARAIVGLSADVAPLVSGMVTSFGVGIVALVMLRRFVTAGGFPLFAIWVLPVAVATLGLAWAWPR